MSDRNDTITALLTKMVSIPKGANVIRLPGPRPSAVANPFYKPVLNWATPPVAAQQLLPADEAIVMVTNDPLCCMMYTHKNPNSDSCQYIWAFSGVGAAAQILVAPGATPDLSDDLCWAQPNAGTPFFGPRLYARLYKGKKWMWCPAAAAPNASNNIVIATVSGMAGTDAITVTIYRLNEGDELEVFSQHITGPFAGGAPVLTFTLPAADYYRVVIVGDDDNTTATISLTITSNSICEHIIHLALPDLTERQANLVQAIRVLGASSHCMNLVSEQNATGSWVGDQPSQGLIWTTYLRGASGSNGFQKLTGQQGNELMELKKFNPYTFVTPEDSDDWEYTIPFNFNASGVVTNTLHRELDKFHYTIVYLKSGGVSPNPASDASRNIQLEFFFALEYTTDGLWPMLGTSPASEDDKAAAIKVLASLENITHNPGFKDIMRTIGKYVRLAPPVLAMLGPYGKAGALIATGAGEIMRRAGYRTRKTARPPKQEGDEEGQHKAPRLAQAAAMDE